MSPIARKKKPSNEWMSDTAVVGRKGQIVLPANLRKRYDLKEGTTVMFKEDHGHLTMVPSQFDDILALAGSLRDLPLEETLEEERQRDRLRESLR